MICLECDQRMQRETVVQVVRSRPFGWPRATVRPGWHCWTCKTSTIAATEGPAAAVAIPHRRGTAHAGMLEARA